MLVAPALDRSAAVGFALNPLDRLAGRRDDAAFIEERRADAATRFFVFAGDKPILKKGGDAAASIFDRDEAAPLGTPNETVFLGIDPAGTALFGAMLDKSAAETLATRDDVEVSDLRALAMAAALPSALLGELGGAKALLDWHGRHRFCANCGTPTKPTASGWRRDCPNCSAQHFPRVDPVVIMLAIDGERCLLGRQPRFVPGMYSALAGFLEPGETIEDAVRREIQEEAGVPCSRVVYHASQPWPFPSSLMIGCFAKAESDVVTPDHDELEDARWFSRDEAAAMLERRHPDALTAPTSYAIAHHLVRAFVEEGPALLG